MNSWLIYLFAAVLIGIGLYCVFLLIQSSKKLAGLKGEPPGEVEDLDKTRAELLEENLRLKAEIESYKRLLSQKKSPKEKSSRDPFEST